VFELSSSGSFKNTEDWLKKLAKSDFYSKMDEYGRRGVQALSSATPVDSGETATSWYYEIVRKQGYTSIEWRNSHMAGSTPVAILLQYGHGTGTGGYVQGRDFINPAIQPIMDQIAADVWKVVTS
jgi:hypothetical protein